MTKIKILKIIKTIGIVFIIVLSTLAITVSAGLSFLKNYDPPLEMEHNYDFEWMLGKSYDEIEERYGKYTKLEPLDNYDQTTKNCIMFYPIHDSFELKVDLMIVMDQNGNACSFSIRSSA